MDDKFFDGRLSGQWARVGLVALVTALIVAPLTAVASHTFIDVSDTDTFHDDIAWLEASGVTKGCNPPDNDEFCPDDPVTREQMAAFLHRFARYMDAEDGTPSHSDNAGTVDGKNAADLMVVAAADIDSDPGGTPVLEVTTINQLTIEAPTNGILIISGNAHISVGSTATPSIKPYVDGTAVGVYGSFDPLSPGTDDDDRFDNLSYTTAVEVAAGTHTVRQDVGQLFADGLTDANLQYNANNLTAIFVPAGNVTVTGASAG